MIMWETSLYSLLAMLPLGEFLSSSVGQQWVVGILLIALFVCFVKEIVPIEIASLSAAGLLIVLGVLDVKEVLRSFANSGPLTVVCMFILSAALERTGAISGLSKSFNMYAKGSSWRALLVLTLGAVGISAFVNNTPIVVILMPVVLSFCRNNEIAPSKLLIPLSFATILGGTCSVVGTSTNILVLGFCQQQGYNDIRMFTMTPLGLIYCLVGLIFIWTYGRKFLPNRETLSTLLPQSASRDFLLQVRVKSNSPLVGKSALDVLRADLAGLRLMEVRRRGVSLSEDLTEISLEKGDRLLVLTTAKKIPQIRESNGLEIGWEACEGLDALEKRDVFVAEGMIGVESSFVGKTLAELKLRQTYNLLVLAIHRKGVNITDKISETALKFGDTLLFEGTQDGLRRVQEGRKIIMLSQTMENNYNKSKMKWAIGAMAAFVLVGLLGSFKGNVVTDFCAKFDPFILAYLGALAVIIMGCLKPREAYKSVDWGIIFLIFGMLAVGKGMEQSGLAKTIAIEVVNVCRPYGPVVVLSGIYLLASILTEMISNNAVAIVLAPLAMEIADKFDGASPLPFLFAVMFGASASFATPIGYQTNTYVYNAGGYKFSDFLKVGLPLNILLWGVFTLLAPWLFPLYPGS